MNNAELTNCLCENAYKRGIQDMKDIILTIEKIYDNNYDREDTDLLTYLFGCSHDNYRMIFDNFTFEEIKGKIKQYKQIKENNSIKVGDVVKQIGVDSPVN